MNPLSRRKFLPRRKKEIFYPLSPLSSKKSTFLACGWLLTAWWRVTEQSPQGDVDTVGMGEGVGLCFPAFPGRPGHVLSIAACKTLVLFGDHGHDLWVYFYVEELASAGVCGVLSP